MVMQRCVPLASSEAITFITSLRSATKMSAIVRFPEKPYKRYWVAKSYDDEVANKQVFSVLNPKWCQPEILKCQFPADMKVSEQVKQRGESMKPAESDWITFSYVYFSQTGKIIL